MNKFSFTSLLTFVAALCAANLISLHAQTPVPGTRYCLKNSSVVKSVQHEYNGKLSLTSDGKVKSELFTGEDEQRAEARLADVDPGDRFGFGLQMSGLSGSGKVWQVIGPPWNGNALAVTLKSSTGHLVLDQAGKTLKDLGSGSGSHNWYFKVHAARQGSIEIYKNGELVTTYNGDLNLGQSKSRLRLGRYNRSGRSAVGYFDKIYIDNLKPVTEYTTGTCSQTSTPPPSGTIINEDFSSASDQDYVRAFGGGVWQVADGKLRLTDPAAASTAANSNLATYERTVVPAGDFTLTAEASVVGTSSSWNDFSIVFGFTDVNNYYYASFNESNDGGTSGIFRVSSGVITQVADITTLITADTAYQVKIERRGAQINVYLNDGLVSTATESGFTGAGYVGFGSRNDAAIFDSLKVIQ